MSLSGFGEFDEFDDIVYEGISKGIVGVEARCLRNAVLIVLRERFKPIKVPKKIKSAIQRMNRRFDLESLICRAFDCQTLDEFAEALN
jgi:hypothetical protein